MMGAITLTKELYFTTTTVIDWVDIFTRPAYKRIVVEFLAYCQEQKGLDIYAWVLMTNHLHMIAGTNKADIRLSDILRDFKKYTNKKILSAIENNQQESRKAWILDRCRFAGNNDKKIKNYRFWQEGNYVEQLYTYDFFKQKIDYIHLNPVKQEIVERPEDYLYSSARNYAGMKGLLNVIMEL